MPVLQRKLLRQRIAQRRLNEITLGNTSLSWGAGASLMVLDRNLALPDFSGQGLYVGAWLRVASVDYRVGSFNAGSGAFVGLQGVINTIQSGADFEVHEKLPADLIDGAIDDTILDLHVRQEIGIPSVDGKTFYSLSGAASPHRILSVLGAYYFANPNSSLNRDRREFDQFAVVTTGSGLEFRPPYALGASVRIVIDALLQLTMTTPGDAGTINLPDDETVLWGAAARCYDLLMQRAPSDETKKYAARRLEAARKYSRLAQRFAPAIAKKFSFEVPFESAARPWLE